MNLDTTRKRDTELVFSLVHPDFKGNYVRKHLGSVKVGSKGPDDLKSLQSLRFMIGDYMTLAIHEP